LINGGFDLWQRGTANASVDINGYLADRWFATAGTYDRIAANLPTGVKYGASLAFSSSNGYLCQRVESANSLEFSGQKMTISGYERSSTGTGPLKIKIDRPNTIDNYAGVGKLGTTVTNEVAATTLLAATSTTSTIWRYTFTVSANMASYGFQVCLGTDTNTATTYELSKIMLNEGIKKQAFRRSGNTISGELNLVQRYYEKSYDIDTAPGTNTENGQFNVFQSTGNGATTVPTVFFKVTKRSSGINFLYFRDDGTANVWSTNSAEGAWATTLDQARTTAIGQNSFGIYATIGTFNRVAIAMWGHWIADNEL
jgi:hypothetical protein